MFSDWQQDVIVFLCLPVLILIIIIIIIYFYSENRRRVIMTLCPALDTKAVEVCTAGTCAGNSSGDTAQHSLFCLFFFYNCTDKKIWANINMADNLLPIFVISFINIGPVFLIGSIC